MTYGTVVTILSAIITGGFVLVFVEIGNRKNRENDNYGHVINPFMKQLSAYFRYVNWTAHRIIYPKDLTENEKEFKYLVEKMGRYGSELIISGGDFSKNDFPADELSEICYGINNIWYYYDRMNPRRLKWDEDSLENRELVDKELIKLNEQYLKGPSNLQKLIKVSADFFVDIYQPIEDKTYYHEIVNKLYRFQSVTVCASIFAVLVVLCLMVCVEIPLMLLKVLAILIVCQFGICLLMLLINQNRQLRWYSRARTRISKWCKKEREK